MRILHIHTSDSGGGAALNTFRVAMEEIRMGHASKILVGKRLTSKPNYRKIKGYLSIKYLNRYINQYKLRDLFFTGGTNLFTTKAYQNCDVVVLHNLHGGYFKLGNLIRISREKPTVWIFHDMWPICGNTAHTFGNDWWVDNQSHKPNPTEFLDKLSFNKKKKVYSKSNFHIVTPSKWLHDLVGKSILKEFDISLINNGIDSNIIKPINKEQLRDKYGINRDTKVISFIAADGTKNRWKGGEYLLEAVEALKKKYNILFLEIGAKTNKIIKGKNHWEIPFVQRRKKINEYLNLSDVFIFTSLAENFPLVLLEAQSAGIPTVTFDVGGCKEIVKHKETGYVAKYKDTNDIVKGIESILDNHNLGKEYSQNARENVLQNFTLEKQASDYIKLYEEVIKEFKNN